MIAPWRVPNKPIPVDTFGSLEPERVLIDYGYPVLFTTRNAAAQQLLVFHVEEATEPTYASRYIAAPTTNAIIDDLERGRPSIREALTHRWLWAIERDAHGALTKADQVEVTDLPDDALPSRNTMISPDLESPLTVKYTGHALQADTVRASILQAAGASVQSALRMLTDFLAGTYAPSGRRENRFRQLYNLPVQHIAFASLEIAFRRPIISEAQTAIQERLLPPDATEPPPITTEELEQHMWQMLRTGLRWLNAGQDVANLHANSDEERLAILRALEKLTPTADTVEEVIIGGSEVARHPSRPTYRVDKAAKKTIASHVQQLQAQLETVSEQRIFKGRLVRGFDLDERTFVLRTQTEIDAGGGGSTFELVNDADVELVRDANHDPGVPVVVMATRMRSRKAKDDTPWEVVNIEFDTTPDENNTAAD